MNDFGHFRLIPCCLSYSNFCRLCILAIGNNNIQKWFTFKHNPVIMRKLTGLILQYF
jgi:hypothetical protein